jgi:hypothetical protein
MLITYALVFRAFGNCAGLLPFTGSVAFKTLGVIFVLAAAVASRALGVLVFFHFLGHLRFLL